MKRKSFSWLVVSLFSFALVGCSTLKHNIGEGAPEGAPKVGGKRQFYILWGLVPINKVDGGEIAKEHGLTNNYTIKSSSTFLDLIISGITSIVTVNCQSVAVMGNPSASPAASNSPAATAAPAASSSNATAYLSAGNQMMGTKDYVKALQYYQAAAQVDPQSAAAYQGIGTCYYYQGKNAEAKQALQKSVELNPSNTQLANFLKSIP